MQINSRAVMKQEYNRGFKDGKEKIKLEVLRALVVELETSNKIESYDYRSGMRRVITRVQEALEKL